MVLLDVGMNKIRDLIYDDLLNGQSGTSGTVPGITNTVLLSPIASTLSALSSKSITDKRITVAHSISSTTANGQLLQEFGVTFTDGTFLNRVVHAPISKNNTLEIDYITSFFINNG